MEEKKKKIKINYLVNLIWYFIIFSVIGLIVETSFGFATTGVIESRKGFVYGPLCPIYGLGAVLIIWALDRFKDSKMRIFFYGMIAGALVEYLISFILEIIYGIRFWDYSYLPYNLNGRICLRYSGYWGILSLIIIYLVKPRIDKLINKIPKKETIAKIAFIILIIDAILTFISISIYQERARRIYNKLAPLKEPTITQVIFSNDFMKKTFPNIRIKANDGSIIFVKELMNKSE